MKHERANILCYCKARNSVSKENGLHQIIKKKKTQKLLMKKNGRR
jgi:hypothetical protein